MEFGFFRTKWTVRNERCSYYRGVRKERFDCKTKISRAWRRLHIFVSSSDWFIAWFVSVVIGQSDCFGFGFTTLTRNVPKTTPQVFLPVPCVSTVWCYFVSGIFESSGLLWYERTVQQRHNELQ